MRRARSPTNGTVSAASLSPGGVGAGEGRGEGSAFADVGAGVAGGEGVGATLLLAEGCPLDSPGSSSLVKYRNPATPMPTRDTTVAAKGHIQFGLGAVWTAGGFFFNCGVAYVPSSRRIATM